MSDTMCAKTTETSRCQRCGSEFDWLSDGTKVHAGKRYFESDSLLCLERQLNAANDRIKRLKESFDKTSKAACKHIKRLEGEVYAFRLYGNRDCTAMADQALKEGKL